MLELAMAAALRHLRLSIPFDESQQVAVFHLSQPPYDKGIITHSLYRGEKKRWNREKGIHVKHHDGRQRYSAAQGLATEEKLTNTGCVLT